MNKATIQEDIILCICGSTPYPRQGCSEDGLICHFFEFDFGDSIRYMGKRTGKSKAVSPLVAPTWATATLARCHLVLQPPPAAPPPERAVEAYTAHGDGGGGASPLHL